MDLFASLLWAAIQAAALQPPRIAETMTVTASIPSLATPAAVTSLNRIDLETIGAATLDDALRAVPGFGLFRRSSSRVANPTTQGVTLRGLAASGASRALVLADDVPLNDPFGGWVYWNRVPSAALSEVSVARGAAGDLFGADALAGVVSIRSSADAAVRAVADAGSGGQARVSAYGGYRRLFGSAEGYTTDGFVIVAPDTRGPVDTKAGSRHGSAHAGAALSPARGALWIRGSHFGESRRNGTPAQRNSTRLTQGSARFARALANGATVAATGYALTQDYEQTFSAVFASRTAERLTSEQEVASTAMGGGAEFGRGSANGNLAMAVNARHVVATLREHEVATASRRELDAQQTTAALSAQGRRVWGRFGAGAGVRLEMWRTRQDDANHHVFVTPKALVTFSPSAVIQARVAVQSGYRGPTINELYRPFRVGSVLTQANANLEPERAVGIESGVTYHRNRFHLRLVGFSSRVSDAIVNVTLSAAGDAILRQRQNAAEIGASGAELEADLRLGSWISLTGATSYTRSRFTKGPLDGRRVPQVPEAQHAVGLRVMRGALSAAADWRFIGAQFDDDLNAFDLDASSMFDARVGWKLRRQVELFGAIENVLDEEQDVGRTPVRTIGLPRTTRAGVRVTF